MKPTLCSKCKKNVAVIFITKVENGKSTNEGLCLKCAKSLGIKQVDEIVAWAFPKTSWKVSAMK